MSRRVLLVDSDVDSLGALAEALRTRGLGVQVASEPFDAVEAAFQSRPDVILVAAHLDVGNEFTDAIRAVPELCDTPVLRLVDGADAPVSGEYARRSDLDRIISRVSSASPRETRPTLPQEIRGTLEQMSLLDLLQLLAMNKRSGVLSVLTTGGAGEVRLVDGEIVDAMLRRLEGEKALFRLLGERDGSFAFLPAPPRPEGAVEPPRRITSSTSMLLIESMRQLDELAKRRSELAPNDEVLLVDEAKADEVVLGGVASEIVKVLEHPHDIDEVLDEVAAPDLTVLAELEVLVRRGWVRRIARAELTTPFAPPEQVAMLRAVLTRLARPWYAPPRLVVATSAKRLPSLAHAIRRITDSIVPTETPPRIALPRWLGTLRLGDGVELAIVGLPTEESLSPTWSLSLPGAVAVVRLDDAGGAALEAHCKGVEVQLVDAEALIGEVDAADPAQIAALLRSTLELVAGV